MRRPTNPVSVEVSPAHGADAALKGVQPLVRSRYTFPSRLPDPGRLAVPTRPVVVGAASIHALRFQSRTAPSFNDPLRRAAVGSFTPLGHSTPRGALRARSATRPVATGGHRTVGLSRPSSKPACPCCVLPKAPKPNALTVIRDPDRALERIFIPRTREP